MEKGLSQQVQDVINQLAQAAEQTEEMEQALRAELNASSPSFDPFDEDIERVLHLIRRLKALVERYEDNVADTRGGNGSPLA
jgi:hypothetical protein